MLNQQIDMINLFILFFFISYRNVCRWTRSIALSNSIRSTTINRLKNINYTLSVFSRMKLMNDRGLKSSNITNEYILVGVHFLVVYI